jgi:hypothetical protein
MLPKLSLVQKLHLPCGLADLEKMKVNRRRGLIDADALRAFLGKQLLREILLRCHGIRPESLDEVQAKLISKVRLLNQPPRISLSYRIDKGRKQTKQFRILFASKRIPDYGYELTPQSFRQGDRG